MSSKPFASFDAVNQRRHHAFCPERSFHPRPIAAGFCALFSPIGHCRCCHLPLSVCHVSTFLPCLPSAWFCSPRLSRLAPLRYYAGSDSCQALARTRQVSPLTPLYFPNIPPPTTPCARTSLYQSLQRIRLILGFAMNEQARRHMPPNRVRQPTGCSFASGCSPPRLAATQLPSTTQGVTPYGMDFHHTNKASSRTHSLRPGGRTA
jgi:hypothetical protein